MVTGLMGMEALETVIGYWEDALAAYNPTGERERQKRMRSGYTVLYTVRSTLFIPTPF